MKKKTNEKFLHTAVMSDFPRTCVFSSSTCPSQTSAKLGKAGFNKCHFDTYIMEIVRGKKINFNIFFFFNIFFYKSVRIAF